MKRKKARDVKIIADDLIDLSAFPTRDTKKELEEMNKFLEEWLRKKHDKELIEEWD